MSDLILCNWCGKRHIQPAQSALQALATCCKVPDDDKEETMKVPLDMNFLNDKLRAIHLDLTQMIMRPNTRTPQNLAECKRNVVLLQKHLEQVARG